LVPNEQLAVFRQVIGPSIGRDVGNVGWTGEEVVAFRLHLPSRVPWHNAPSEIERGNIIRWEQPLTDRLKGQPLAIEVHLENESILVQTLSLFGLTIVLALATLGLAVWFVMRRKGAELPGTGYGVPRTDRVAGARVSTTRSSRVPSATGSDGDPP
jgi:hypothetical protein